MRLRIYIFAFIFALSVVLMGRGLFLLTRYQLGMTDLQNLFLALASGFAYIWGGQLSHQLEKKVSPKNAVIYLLFVQILMPLICYFFYSFSGLILFFSLFLLANGMTWPFAASYASAGLNRKTASSSIGIYNICWSLAVSIAALISGWLISKSGTGFFYFVSLGVSISVLPILFLPEKIPHNPETSNLNDEPEEKIVSIKQLLLSSRWSMFFSLCLLQLLNSLLPGRFYELGISLGVAGFAAGFIDLSRTAGFLFMSRTDCWHGNKTALFLLSPALAIGFIICMFAEKLSHIIVGGLIIGFFAAVSYYSALFYAMHMHKASVGAGGTHESVIGMGFFVGPIAGLLSEKILLIPLFGGFSNSSISIFLLGFFSIPASIFALLKKDNNTCKKNLENIDYSPENK